MAIHLYQAACDLSDIQCAAALAYNGEKKDSSDSSNDNKGVAEDRAFSMNPFPGSTRAYPKSEIELQKLVEDEERMKKNTVVSEVDEEEEGVEVNLEEGVGEIESADLRELMKMAGLAEVDEEKEEEPDAYSTMESYRDKLDADVALRATEIVTARADRGARYIADKASLSLRDLARLEPCGVLAVCPSMPLRDLEHVGR